MPLPGDMSYLDMLQQSRPGGASTPGPPSNIKKEVASSEEKGPLDLLMDIYHQLGGSTPPDMLTHANPDWGIWELAQEMMGMSKKMFWGMPEGVNSVGRGSTGLSNYDMEKNMAMEQSTHGQAAQEAERLQWEKERENWYNRYRSGYRGVYTPVGSNTGRG